VVVEFSIKPSHLMLPIILESSVKPS